MKKFLTTAVALGLSALFAASANAQSAVPYTTPYNWTGAYAGVFGGAASAGHATTSDPCAVGSPCTVVGTYNAVAPTTYNLNQRLDVGGELGLNWQAMDHLLVGFENKTGYMRLTGSTVQNAPPVGNGDTQAVTRYGNWFDAYTVRGGFVADHFLFFVEGGGAVAKVSTGVIDTTPPVTINTAPSKFINGWAAGGGLEYAIDQNWSVKAEVLELGFQQTIKNCSLVGGFAPATIDCNSSKIGSVTTFNVGVNYRFWAPPSPPPEMAPTPVVAAPPPAAIVAKKQMFIVFFEFDKSTLTPDGKKVVDAAAAAFKSGKSDVAVAGYTDLAGSQQYNLALSHRRADAVKAALVKDGVSTSAIGESWYGKQNPRVPTADGVREPQNRRVEITM